MTTKRNLMPNFYKQIKRFCANGAATTATSTGNKGQNDPTSETKNVSGELTDVLTAILTLRSYFPLKKYNDRLPAIIFKHQLYSLIKNKTEVDRQLNDLKLKGEVRLFHIGPENDNICILLKQDYLFHVRKIDGNKSIMEIFLTKILERNLELSISKETLMKDLFKEEDITELMRIGVVTVRDVGTWWFSIPGVGEFVKSYISGKKAILLMIRKSKFGEMLQKDLEERKLPKVAKLGIMYHIHDIVGSEIVTCINTTSGRLLRLKE